jgi:hypothetical protein
MLPLSTGAGKANEPMGSGKADDHAFLARFWYHLPVFVYVNFAPEKCTRG